MLMRRKDLELNWQKHRRFVEQFARFLKTQAIVDLSEFIGENNRNLI